MGTCYFKSFEDIVTSGSKIKYSREGIISEMGMCPLKQKKSVEQVEVASNLTHLCCQFSKWDEYKSLFDLPICTPVHFHLAQDLQLPASKGKGLEEIKVSQSPTNSCCQYFDMDEYKALFGLPTCTPVHFHSAKDLQLPANKRKGLEEIKVSQSLTKSCCQYSKIDEYKSLFGLPTCTPVHFHLAQDLQLPVSKRKDLEEIGVSQSPTNSCCQYSKMDGYKALFGLPICTPVHFDSAQDSQLPVNKEKGLEEIEVSQSPTKSCCLYSKMDEYKALFGLPTCTPVHFDSAQDSQLPANKEKGLEEIEVSQSPTNSCCQYSKIDEYKSLFGLPTCTPVHFDSAQDSQLL